MTDTIWKWARLDRKSLDLVRETETTLGADVVLAYGQGGPLVDGRTRDGLHPASLDAGQLERLQGVEAALGVVAVAYRRA